MATQLIYVHDPMCSWCWAFRPALETLCRTLPRELPFHRLLGGLAPDDQAPMPEAMRRRLKQTWQHITHRVPDTAFNFDFWTCCEPRRSTYPACRAVIAARRQKAAAENTMIEAIQRAYYTQARNPSLNATLIELSAEIGLDPTQFGADLTAAQTDRRLRAEITKARSLGVDSFPGLVLIAGGTRWRVAVDYRHPRRMLEQVIGLLA